MVSWYQNPLIVFARLGTNEAFVPLSGLFRLVVPLRLPLMEKKGRRCGFEYLECLLTGMDTETVFYLAHSTHCMVS